MQPPKLMRIIAAALLLVSGVLAPFCYAQSPVVLSAPDEPLVFELPTTPNLTRQLTPSTTAKLATPAQHQERGLAYPLWLSDASFTVKARTAQRQSVVVEAKRGNPNLSTDLLLALNNKGVRALESSTLIFDKINVFTSAAPMPPANLAIQPDLASGFADLRKTAAPIQFPDASPKAMTAAQASPPTAIAAPAAATPHVDMNVRPYVTKNSDSKQPKRMSVANSQQKSQSIVKSEIQPASQAALQTIPDKAPQVIPPASQATLGLPATPPSAILPKLTPQSKLPPEPSWLDDWPLMTGAASGLLLLAYLVTRLLKRRAKTNDFENTRSPSEQVANTVFGLSDKEADAMHKKWLSDQILSKNKK